MLLSRLRNYLRIFNKKSDFKLRYPRGRRISQSEHGIRNSDMEMAAIRVVNRISRKGHRSYLVGGCIRDLLMGKYPKDFDVVSSASPYRLKQLFSNSRIIGRRFKILHVPINRYRVIEVSTFRSLPRHRKDTKKLEHKKKSILMRQDNRFGTGPEDAARRDITINALFYDAERQEIIDYCGGYDDLKAKRIKVIGNPELSFREDPVRMLRVAKFCALLNFEIEPRTLRAIARFNNEIKKSSKNRMLGEINKIFVTGQSFKIFRSLYQLSLLKHMIPTIIPFVGKGKRSSEEGAIFDQSRLGKRLAIADKMLSEREDLTVNVFFALLFADLVNDLLENKIEKKVMEYLDAQLKPTFELLHISKRNQERLKRIYLSQRRFQKNQPTPHKKNTAFRQKGFFYEAFTFFKIYAISCNKEDWIQQTMQWEFGPRNTPPQDSQIISLFQHHKPKKLAKKSEKSH